MLTKKVVDAIGVSAIEISSRAEDRQSTLSLSYHRSMKAELKERFDMSGVGIERLLWNSFSSVEVKTEVP